MPRILRIINRLNLGGPTLNVAYLSKYLSPEYETMVVAGVKDDTEASSEYLLTDLGIEPVYIGSMKRSIHPLEDRKAYKQISKIIRDYKPDIVHTHAAKAGALGRLAAINAGVPVVLHTFHGHVFHSYFNPVKTRLFLEIERYLARKSSAIVAISDKQKQELTEEFNVASPEKVHVVNLGFDLEKFSSDKERKREEFRAKYSIADDEIAIGIIGRLVPVKNHNFFLEAIAKLLKSTPRKVRAFVVGDGELREQVREKARSLNIPFAEGTDSIQPLTFTSWIKAADEVMAGMDIIALTSMNEGTPVSLIEAQAAGKAIVSTRVGGIEDVVLEGETAWLSDRDDVNTFVKHLLYLVENDAAPQNGIQKGPAFAMENFHYSRLVRDMEALYKRLM